jgi:membrane protease YdiL (CAAX protease family)
MSEILVITLLIVVALLSKAGRLRKNPVSGASLSNLQSLIVQRGICCMLMIPALVYATTEQPFWIQMTTSAAVSTGVILVLVPLLSLAIVRPGQSSTPHDVYHGLQTGSQEWFWYLVTTSVYMIVYEILLRGIILHYLVDWVGISLAVTLNTLIYAAMHLVKDRREALLCVPLGIFICWITLYTKSIWPAAVLHVIMALSFELLYNAKRTHVNV